MPHPLRSSRRGFTMKELLVVILLVASTAAALPPVADAMRERDRRIQCAVNLRIIGQAIQMYANENRGNFPRTRFDAKNPNKVALFTNWKAPDPFGKDGPGPNDVTSGLFLLLRTQDITPEVMLCPSDTRARPVNVGPLEGEAGEGEGEEDPVAALEPPRDPRGFPTTRGAYVRGPTTRFVAGWPPEPEGPAVAESVQDISNFPDRRNLSYSYVNPYPSQAAMDAGFKLNYTLTSDYAIAADINPGGEAVVKLQPGRMPTTAPYARRSPPKFTETMRKANSPNHGGFGQNVLYADGHVEWQPTPFCGTARDRQQTGGRQAGRDNIYVRQFPTDRTDPIVGPVSDQLDTILLPTASAGGDGEPEQEQAPEPAPAPRRRATR